MAAIQERYVVMRRVNESACCSIFLTIADCSRKQKS